MSLFTSLLTAGTNSHEETSENANAVATDFVTTEGVVGAYTNTSGVSPATGGFAVNAQGTPDMTVAVSTGVAYVTATPSSQNSQSLRVRNSASANVTISANSSGSTKYDWVYIKVDATAAANPAVNADDVATLVTSRSSSASSDDGTPPTYGTLLAVVTVSNGASSISNSNIADKRVQAGATPADASILPHMFYGNGSVGASTPTSWAWKTFSPSLTNFTVGSGGSAGTVAKYIEGAGVITVKLRATLGTSGQSVSGEPTFNLPATASSNFANFDPLGLCWMNAGGTGAMGYVRLISTTQAKIVPLTANATYVGDGTISSSVPGTWAAGNFFTAVFEYEPA